MAPPNRIRNAPIKGMNRLIHVAFDLQFLRVLQTLSNNVIIMIIMEAPTDRLYQLVKLFMMAARNDLDVDVESSRYRANIQRIVTFGG